MWFILNYFYFILFFENFIFPTKNRYIHLSPKWGCYIVICGCKIKLPKIFKNIALTSQIFIWGVHYWIFSDPYKAISITSNVPWKTSKLLSCSNYHVSFRYQGFVAHQYPVFVEWCSSAKYWGFKALEMKLVV